MEMLLGQMLFFGGNFAPRSYMFCQGQILSIAQNTALFSILGTTYGGNGQTTFALPDSRGRTFIGAGSGPGLTPRTLGEMAGTESDTLTLANIPPHIHTLQGTASVMMQALSGGTIDDETDVPTAGSFLGSVIGSSSTVLYVPAGTGGTTPVPLGGCSITGTTGPAGAGMPINNMQPYLAVNFIIVVEGLFPSRN